MNSGDIFHSFSTKDGQRISVRPLKPEDAHYLVDLFEHMGPESRYLRFNLALTNPDPELVWTEAQRLAQIDPERDGAWLAFCDLPNQPGAAVGGARYVRIDATTAEASLAVRDDMQNKGIGTELLQLLIEQARLAGISKLVANVQRGNRALWRLLQRSGIDVNIESSGSYTEISGYISEIETVGKKE